VLAAPLLLGFLLRPRVGVLGFIILMHGFLRALGSANEMPVLCEVLPSHRRGAAMGLMNSMNTFIGGSGVFLSGVLMSYSGLSSIFIGLAGFVLMAAAVALVGYFWILPRDLARKQKQAAA
jgi:predicted MFS family arabinose efflux permease